MSAPERLLLQEEVLQLSEPGRSEALFSWLNRLRVRLQTTEKAEIKQVQRRLVEQLSSILIGSPGPPARVLLAHCLALLFRLGDPLPASILVEKCNDIIRSKDDSPSALPSRLAAVACLGSLFEQLGRLLSGSCRDTVTNLLRALKNAESQGRCEILAALEKMLRGLGPSAAPVHRDIYKSARTCLSDRSSSVRCAAAKCLLELQQEALFLSSSELENVSTVCFRAFEGSSPNVRVCVSELLGSLLSTAVQPRTAPPAAAAVSLQDVMELLLGGFVRGGAGFLRASGDKIKGTSSVSKDVRLGIAQTCVLMVSSLGPSWLEQVLPQFLVLLLDLAAHARTTLGPSDVAMTRGCVVLVLRKTLGGVLGERAQSSAVRHLCATVAAQKHSSNSDAAADPRASSELSSSQHMLVCVLLELGALLLGLGSTAGPLLSDPSTALVDSVITVLLHPSAAARLAASWCLRCVAVAMPSQNAALLDRCTERLTALKSSPEAVSGFGSAVCALVSAAQHHNLGLPHSRGKMVLALAEDLLRSACQNSRISLQRTQVGWMLLTSLTTLGPSSVDHLLSRLLLLCRCVFPASLREQDAELRRGDYFTWQVTLEGRSGALCVLRSLLLHCKDLMTDDALTRLLTPLSCATALLNKLGSLLRSYGGSIRPFTVLYRLRVYELLTELPPHTYQESFGLLMNQLVSDLCSQDQPGPQSPLMPSLCCQDDQSLISPGLDDPHHTFTDQLWSSGSGGSLENDPFCLTLKSDEAPAPPPSALALMEVTVRLFGNVFPHIISAQRVKVLEQFVDVVNQLKGQKQQTVQTQACAALCWVLQVHSGSGSPLGPPELRPPALSLLWGALESPSAPLRCAAAEGVARLVQSVNDSAFTVSIALQCFDRLKTSRDAASRSGVSLALGALYRYVGGISSPQHLCSCISVLFTLSQDTTSPTVQAWALHSLSLIVDLSGGLFRLHCEPCVSLVLHLLLSTPPHHHEVLLSLGRCLHALITCLGPDLQEGSVAALRDSISVGCQTLQVSQEPLVQSRAVSCLQQLHMFSPAHVDLRTLVPTLCGILLENSQLVNLSSSSLVLRRAVVSCLRQIVQREALEVSELAVSLAKEQPPKETSDLELTLRELGLEGALFSLLDRESDSGLRRDLQETLGFIMSSSLSSGRVGQWLRLCRDVLSATTDHNNPDVLEDEEEKEDWSALGARSERLSPFSALRWSTRRIAVESVCSIIQTCAKTGTTDLLVPRLGDLVRMAFMASTDHSAPLRLSGLQTLMEIITAFRHVEEPEFPGHFLLEQYQANVGAALRPAFAPDAPPHVTAKACQVCSAWISSGVVSDLRDLRRVHQLLVSSLSKVHTVPESNSQLYNEAAATMETLAVLKAWAQVYIVAVQRSKPSSDWSTDSSTANDSSAAEPEGAGLLQLVQSDLPSLSRLWLAVLQDHAALGLSLDQASSSGGSFYSSETVDQARPHYSASWGPILHATALWLHSTGFVTSEDTPVHLSRPATPTSLGCTGGGATSPEDVGAERLHLILGVAVQFLCAPHSENQMENIESCLNALQVLLDAPWPRSRICTDQSLSVELLSVLLRLMVTRECGFVQRFVLDLLKQIVSAAQEHVREKRHSAEVDDGAAEKETVPVFGEGRDTGGLVPGRSLVFSALQICLCVLIRKLPQLSPTLSGTKTRTKTRSTGEVWSLSDSDCGLVSSAVFVLSELPSLCSPEGSVSILPTVLYLLLGVLRELVHRPRSGTGAASGPDAGPVSDLVCGPVSGPAGLLESCLQSLRGVLFSPMSRQEKSRESWIRLLQSALSSVLALWDHDDPELEVDQGTLLRALSLFLSSSSGPDVCCVPPLLPLCLERFSSALDCKDPQVSAVCFQLLRTLFQSPDPVSVVCIRALGPALVRYLKRVERVRPQTQDELRPVQDAIVAMETLVQAAEPQHRDPLVSLLLPLLVSFLLDENALSSAPSASRSLHDSALKDLMRIGPQHPSLFRSVMSSSPELKSRLEAAVRVNQERVRSKPGPGPAPRGQSSNSSPSIKLKTHFL